MAPNLNTLTPTQKKKVETSVNLTIKKYKKALIKLSAT